MTRYKDLRKSKSLYSSECEGVQTYVGCWVRKTTGHIGIYTMFRKQHNWSGIINNTGCATYLGVHVAERLLADVFDNIDRMPNNNPGFDFICGGGYKIDVKAVCLRKNRRQWSFTIGYNTIADYFLCLAFDNRNDLNPLHIWLIPGYVINHRSTANISEGTIDRWSKYEMTDKLDKIKTCCNIMRTSNNDNKLAQIGDN